MNAEQKAFTLPKVIFGTSSLGNLYEIVPQETKRAIVNECVAHAEGSIVFDTAGKYGAGLALEALGSCLSELGVDPSKVIISNKLGWYRVPLTTEEPTFEPGVWKGLMHDAVQRISYEGIMDCFHQGNGLLGAYQAQLVSVHDPDEYLANATTKEEEEAYYQDILGAYKALAELKDAGQVLGIGVGSKQWKVIERISKDIDLDWVMIANSLTVYDHPQDLMRFVNELHEKGVSVINSAVFNGGFLVGSAYYNYKPVDERSDEGKALLDWREQFWAHCAQYDIKPAEACFNFGFNIPGVCSVALNTTKPEKVRQNIDMAEKKIPAQFWSEMIRQGMIKGL
ncbi:aldo/keto reductase [Sphingobacterium pedocola]|uniref:L-fucose dehydrogenase n=1 Tax=Sphingobacterium pedocola TaxID=2082722 RepID=A0ABR9T970_9SPHI|nr:aldo/keto reductase [Sphingobacterium pedocola]MBE8721893.1 L-fucose dehydrogenase [Sphingobacterium pedocola]